MVGDLVECGDGLGWGFGDYFDVGLGDGIGDLGIYSCGVSYGIFFEWVGVCWVGGLVVWVLICLLGMNVVVFVL